MRVKQQKEMKRIAVLFMAMAFYNLSYAQNELDIEKSADKIVYYFDLNGDTASRAKWDNNASSLRIKNYEMKVETFPEYLFGDVLEVLFDREEDVLLCNYCYDSLDNFEPRIVVDVIYRGKVATSIAFDSEGCYYRNDRWMMNKLFKRNEKMIAWLKKSFGSEVIDKALKAKVL